MEGAAWSPQQRLFFSLPTAADDRAWTPDRPGNLVPRAGRCAGSPQFAKQRPPQPTGRSAKPLSVRRVASQPPDPPPPPKRRAVALTVLAVPHPPVEARFGNPTEWPIPGARKSHAITTGGKPAGHLFYVAVPTTPDRNLYPSQ